jgi:hypothetical protein
MERGSFELLTHVTLADEQCTPSKAQALTTRDIRNVQIQQQGGSSFLHDTKMHTKRCRQENNNSRTKDLTTTGSYLQPSSAPIWASTGPDCGKNHQDSERTIITNYLDRLALQTPHGTSSFCHRSAPPFLHPFAAASKEGHAELS